MDNPFDSQSEFKHRLSIHLVPFFSLGSFVISVSHYRRYITKIKYLFLFKILVK